MAAIPMPRVPQSEMCLLTWQCAQSRLGVRDRDCSKSDVCCYHPEGDGIIQACRTDHKLGNTGPYQMWKTEYQGCKNAKIS